MAAETWLPVMPEALATVLDDLGTGVAIFERGGDREVARNSRLDELERDEPERDRLHEVVARLGRWAAAPVDDRSDRLSIPRQHDVDLELTGGTYRLVTSHVRAGTLLPGAAILILVQRLRLPLPTTRELRSAFGLKGREPHVALLVAEGLSNPAIADRLSLSVHTVRHYVERVFDRLDLHSRKALALHLMEAGRERPRA